MGGMQPLASAGQIWVFCPALLPAGGEKKTLKKRQYKPKPSQKGGMQRGAPGQAGLGLSVLPKRAPSSNKN